MNISTIPTKKIDTKVLLSTLWIVVMINMLKADILSLYIPGAAEEVGENLCQHRRSYSPIDVGRRDHDGDFDCHDHSVPRVEIRRQSLGQYHRQHHHDCVYCGRWSFLPSLHFHCHGRSDLSVADHLVCMEVAQP